MAYCKKRKSDALPTAEDILQVERAIIVDVEPTADGMFSRSDFTYDAERDV